MQKRLLPVLTVSAITFCAGSALAEQANAPPRSDGCSLHVDLEDYTDGIFAPLNAGVVTVGMHEILGTSEAEGKAAVMSEFGFDGRRCLSIRNTTGKQPVRVYVQKRFDAPDCADDSVIEFVFRPVREGSVELRDWLIWDAHDRSGASVGLKILVESTADSDIYKLDVVEGDASKPDRDGRRESVRRKAVGRGLKQNEWIRFILHRRDEGDEVALWAGPPDDEQFIGVFTDLYAAGAFHNARLGRDRGVNAGSGYWDSLRVGRPLKETAEVCPAEPRLRDVGATVPKPPDPVPVGRAKQLFIDDWVVESMSELTRTLHPIKKHPQNPLVVADRPWEGPQVLLYGAVHREPDTGKFRMWYLAWNSYNAARQGRPHEKSFICYATSKDGFVWEKPELDLYEYRGSKQNNIVIGYGMSNTCILYDPRDPDPNRRFKGVIRHNGTRRYLSADGIHWKDDGIILSQCYDSTSVNWDPVRRKWAASVKIWGNGKRMRGYAESDDFRNWSDTYFMATVDEDDLPGDQVYAMTTFYYETAYLGLWRMYHGGDSTSSHKVAIQLAVSHNAKHWERPLRTPFVPCGTAKGSWDYGNNAPSTMPPIRMGDELWFYYSGRSCDHMGRPDPPGTGAIGLGTLRLDGFVSVDAGDKPGTLLTRPLKLEPGMVFVNADAGGGSIVAEIVDEMGKPLPPFTFANCQAVDADSVRQPLTWKGATALPRSPVRLRFRLTNAQLYAFWIEKD